MDNHPERVTGAPRSLTIERPDEVLAARKPILTFRDWLRENQEVPQCTAGV